MKYSYNFDAYSLCVDMVYFDISLVLHILECTNAICSKVASNLRELYLHRNGI